MNKSVPLKSQNLTSFSAKLLDEMQEELDAAANSTTDTIITLTTSIEITNNFLNELRDFMRTYHFQNSEEEINFFKKIKPGFLSQLIYQQKLLALKLSEPCLNKKAKKKYLQRSLVIIQEFLSANQQLYIYCITNSTCLDDKYFLRSSYTSSAIEDKEFNTGYDNKVARIMASMMLKENILSSLQKLHRSETTIDSSLRWSASKVSLIELLYALHGSGSFNRGKIDIKQIATGFEKLFQINLGNYYRVFQDIRMRKTGRTFFLDQLKQSLINHMDEMD